MVYRIESSGHLKKGIQGAKRLARRIEKAQVKVMGWKG
jgi:hypothetical protein